jgi:hypothetical protein
MVRLVLHVGVLDSLLLAGACSHPPKRSVEGQHAALTTRIFAHAALIFYFQHMCRASHATAVITCCTMFAGCV